MNLKQKLICRELIRLSVENGFGCYYQRAPIANKLKIEELLIDSDSETGLLWDFHPAARGELAGMLSFHDDDCASVSYDEHTLLSHWCTLSRDEAIQVAAMQIAPV